MSEMKYKYIAVKIWKTCKRANLKIVQMVTDEPINEQVMHDQPMEPAQVGSASNA